MESILVCLFFSKTILLTCSPVSPCIIFTDVRIFRVAEMMTHYYLWIQPPKAHDLSTSFKTIRHAIARQTLISASAELASLDPVLDRTIRRGASIF